MFTDGSNNTISIDISGDHYENYSWITVVGLLVNDPCNKIFSYTCMSDGENLIQNFQL